MEYKRYEISTKEMSGEWETLFYLKCREQTATGALNLVMREYINAQEVLYVREPAIKAREIKGE